MAIRIGFQNIQEVSINVIKVQAIFNIAMFLIHKLDKIGSKIGTSH